MTTHRRELSILHIAGLFYVVAAANYFDDELFDWAAYLGPWDDEAKLHSDGEKVDPGVAAKLFPGLPHERYRR